MAHTFRTMSDDQFTKLFKYIQEFRNEMHREVARIDARFDDIYGLLDEDLKRRETDEQERLLINHQLNRHVGWFKQLATHTDAKLTPEP